METANFQMSKIVALQNTFSQANTAYGKGKVRTKYIYAVNNFLGAFGGLTNGVRDNFRSTQW